MNLSSCYKQLLPHQPLFFSLIKVIRPRANTGDSSGKTSPYQWSIAHILFIHSCAESTIQFLVSWNTLRIQPGCVVYSKNNTELILFNFFMRVERISHHVRSPQLFSPYGLMLYSFCTAFWLEDLDFQDQLPHLETKLEKYFFGLFSFCETFYCTRCHLRYLSSRYLRQ